MLGADMEAGTLVEWLKQPGDALKRGDIIAVVETQKGAIEIEVFQAGVLERLVAKPGEKLPVGALMATFAGEGETAIMPAGPPPPPLKPPTLPSPAPTMPRPAPAAGARVRASPAARKRAGELGFDLAGLTGSGPDGAVTLADVEARSGARPPALAAPGAQLAMRQAIGAAMTRSKREIPHYYLSTTVDFHGATAWLEAANRDRPVTDRLLYGVLLLKAVALALKQAPEFNGYWSDGGFRPSVPIHIGVAISLRQGGLIAPAIHDADGKPLDQLMREFRDLVRRARSGGLRSSELSDATITVTSLGEQGVDTVFPVIYPPQVAMIGFGTPAERPWASAGQVVARRLLTASLAADHRVSDGHRGARFLAAIGNLLQAPEQL